MARLVPSPGDAAARFARRGLAAPAGRAQSDPSDAEIHRRPGKARDPVRHLCEDQHAYADIRSLLTQIIESATELTGGEASS